MKILAIDTTADVCSVALCDDVRLVAEMTVNTGNTHSQTLLPLVEQVLKITNTGIDDIELFACSTGPGSFTGVRIGVATVKGIAYGKNIPCASISTLEALAYNLIGYDGIICPVMNARRSQVYNAMFECRGGELRRLCPDRAISISDLEAELVGYSSPVYLCGDGYDVTLNGFIGAEVAFTPERSKYQSAYSVACCAYMKYLSGDTVTDGMMVPVYLRPSQAERERQERINAEKNLERDK